MLHSLDNQADGIQQRHLRLGKLDLLHQGHEPVECNLRVWQKGIGLELPLVCNGMELSSGCYSNNLVIQRVALVEEMLEDLVDYGLLLLGHLDGDPLRNDYGNSTTDDVEARGLLGRFHNQGVFQKRVKVDLVVEDVSCKANGCVYRVLEQDILILGSCRR